jgi:hypothetical protein
MTTTAKFPLNAQYANTQASSAKVSALLSKIPQSEAKAAYDSIQKHEKILRDAYVVTSEVAARVSIANQEKTAALKALKAVNRGVVLLAPSLKLARVAEVAAFDVGDDIELAKNLETIFVEARQKDLALLLKKVRREALNKGEVLVQERASLPSLENAAAVALTKLRAELTRGEVVLKLNGVNVNALLKSQKGSVKGLTSTGLAK